MRHVNKRLRTT